MSLLSLVAVTGLALAGAACEKKADAPKAPASPVAPAKTDAHGHDHEHGDSVELGTQTIGGFTVKASRDDKVEAGKEVPFDLFITPPAGNKFGAARIWIGTEDAKGSMKVKCETEEDHYHAHAVAPTPLPEGSKLWVEVENDKGEKHTGSFAIKP
jgi:hypothetical protein